MVEDVCPLPEADKNCPLPLLLGDDFLNRGPCPTRRGCKKPSCGKACHTQIIVSVYDVVGLELLATTIADKKWPLCCQILCWQRLEN